MVVKVRAGRGSAASQLRYPGNQAGRQGSLQAMQRYAQCEELELGPRSRRGIASFGVQRGKAPSLRVACRLGHTLPPPPWPGQVQTNGKKTPIAAVQGALEDLGNEVGDIRTKFQQQLDQLNGGGGGLPPPPY